MSRETVKADRTRTPPDLPRRARPPDIGRHTRKCSICRHPKRDAIEAAFLDWRSPDVIADEYGLPGRSPIYRHVHATGLWARCKRNVCLVLESLLEQAGEVEVTASAVVRAVYIYAHINDAGEWIEPPAPSRSRLVTHHSSLPSSNRDTQELENEPTH